MQNLCVIRHPPEFLVNWQINIKQYCRSFTFTYFLHIHSITCILMYQCVEKEERRKCNF